MIGGRPVRIVLASALLATVAIADVAWYTVSRLALLAECGEACAGEFNPVERFGFGLVLFGLALGLFLRPRQLRLPAAVASAALATLWISPVMSQHNPMLFDIVVLSLLAATPFLLVPPIGGGASRWALLAWIGVIVAAVLLLLLDLTLSGLLATTPPPPQLGLLPFVAAVVLSGLLSARLRRSETHEAPLAVPA